MVTMTVTFSMVKKCALGARKIIFFMSACARPGLFIVARVIKRVV